VTQLCPTCLSVGYKPESVRWREEFATEARHCVA